MNAHRNYIGLALRLALGAALVASPLLVSDLAQADDFTVSSEVEPVEEASSELTQPSTYCSASGTGGRQLASITVSGRDPSVCIRTKLGTPVSAGLPDCWQARAYLGCVTIVDLN